jgi:hypothetical protein
MQEKGVDEEEAIRTILDSDSDEDEEEKKDEDKEGDDKDKDAGEERKEDGKLSQAANGGGDAAVKKKKDLKKKIKKEGQCNQGLSENIKIKELFARLEEIWMSMENLESFFHNLLAFTYLESIADPSLFKVRVSVTIKNPNFTWL